MKALPVCHGPGQRPPCRGGGSRRPYFGSGPRCPGRRTPGGRAYSRASCRSRVRNSMRGWPGSSGLTSGRTTLRRAKPPSKTSKCLPSQALACCRPSSTSSSHLVRKATGGPFWASGSCVLRKYSRPAVGRNRAGSSALGQQGPHDDPVVRPDGGGAVGAAGGVVVEGAGAPDVGAAAMDLGVVAGPDAVAVPGAVGQAVEAAGQALLQEAEVPTAVLGEGLQGLPVAGRGRGRRGTG